MICEGVVLPDGLYWVFINSEWEAFDRIDRDWYSIDKGFTPRSELTACLCKPIIKPPQP